MSKKLFLTMSLFLVCFIVTGCSTAKAPAEAAIKTAEDAISGVKADASVYVPDRLRSAEDLLAAAKENFKKGEYQQALTSAKDIAMQAKDLASEVASKKDELSRTWQNMSGGLPGMVKAIQSRVDILSKSKKLPAGLNKDQFESAKASLQSITRSWDEASVSFKGGNLMEAVNKAKTVKEKAAEIMNSLGMKPPQAAMQ